MRSDGIDFTDASSAMRLHPNGWKAFTFFAALYLAAILTIHLFVLSPISRENVCIEGPGGRPCWGTVWQLSPPKAVIILGHGVTANQAVMAMLANAFVRNDYVVVTIDFWGHGRSREPFDWMSNGDQLNAWCTWVRSRYPGKPLAYLGHSMGGAAGDMAFRDTPEVDAFVSLGMLPRQLPPCKTLIAMGRFEELFSVEQANRTADGKAEVLVSPYSDHTFEVGDPRLIEGIIAWLNKSLGFHKPSEFPWTRWGAQSLAAAFGILAALFLAERIAAAFPRGIQTPSKHPIAPPGPFNPFRPAAWLLRCKMEVDVLYTGSSVWAIALGSMYAASSCMLICPLLTDCMYECNPLHLERLIEWGILSPVMAWLFWMAAGRLECFGPGTAWKRFGVGALTRAVPLFAVCLALQFVGPGYAFGGMILGLVGLVMILISAVYALATRASEDYRAGAVAAGIVLAGIIAFWFPLLWRIPG